MFGRPTPQSRSSLELAPESVPPTLTVLLPGVYNLLSVGGALLVRHPYTAQTAPIQIAAEWNRLPQVPVGIRSK
jgi:hypothetical protein